MLPQIDSFEAFISDPLPFETEILLSQRRSIPFSGDYFIESDDHENQDNNFLGVISVESQAIHTSNDYLEIDHLLDSNKMEEENQILSPIMGTLSNHSTLPETIEVEDSSEESLESRETKESRRNKEAPENSSDEQNSSESSEKNKKNLPHLKMDRRRKGERNQLQKGLNGYWTNNLLRWAKKYHLDWILLNLGTKFLKDHPNVQRVFNKICDKTGKKMQGINMADYVIIYQEQALEKIWNLFFSKKVLYRELMLSKTDPKLKKVYVKFMINFEKAFKTKTFQYLSKTEEHQNI